MSFDFNIFPNFIKSLQANPVQTKSTQSQNGVGLFGCESPTLNNSEIGDSFVRSTTQQQESPVKQQKSGFETTYQQFYNPQKINGAANDKIQSICDEHSISSQVDGQQVANIDKSHLEKTYEYAMMMGNRMGLSQSEKEDLKTGSILHDIGKAYIPDSILNKPGKLDDGEKSVMSSHTELGAELAHQFGANDNVVDMIKNHHNDNTNNKLCKILQVADRYSALTQQRSYKSSYSPVLAFSILDQEVKNGKLDGESLNALKKSVNTPTFYYGQGMTA